MTKLVVVLGACCMLTACVEGRQASYTETNYAPTNAHKIDVVMENAVSHKYVVVGTITENPWADAEANIHDAKQRAAKMGADAITVLVRHGDWLQCYAIKYTD